MTYSAFLRRLSGVTQVVPPDLMSSRRHTRESHSQKVALVSREIAETVARTAAKNLERAKFVASCGGLDLAAAETAGLAHDLGHPPFGHGGEVALNRLLREHDVTEGFEGNAQTFRIVTRLDQRKTSAEPTGMQLTAVTLAAILKYPRQCPDPGARGSETWKKGLAKPPKFGVYQDDLGAFEAVEPLIPGVRESHTQTLEAAIMDLADDVTYALHDLEDFYTEGVVDFNEVEADLESAIAGMRGPDFEITYADESPNPFLYIAKDLADSYTYFDQGLYSEALEAALDLSHRAKLRYRYGGSQSQNVSVTKELGRVFADIFKSLQTGAEGSWKDGPAVYPEQHEWHVIQVLKTITRRYVVGTARIGFIERSQYVAMERLFTGMIEWISSTPRVSEVPATLSSYLAPKYAAKDKLPKQLGQFEVRALADYICSMSDQECLARARWLSGVEVPALSVSR